jgi:protein TonB
MRAAAIASFSVHVVVMTLLFALGTGPVRIIPGPEVVQVALISPSAAITAPPPPPPKPEPKMVEETLKPTDETGVKLAPEKPKKKPVEKPPEKQPDPSTTTTVLPSAPAGPAGLKGDVTVEAGNFEFTYYLMLVRNRVADNWSPPSGLMTRGQPVRAVVYFRIGREGEVMGARLESMSGAEFFDRSALRAVQISDPMPPLPVGYAGDVLGVHFGFDEAP